MKKRLKTYLLDLLTIISITIFTTLIIKQLQNFLKTLQSFPQQLTDISKILSQETLSTYDSAQIDILLNQMDILTYKVYLYQYLLLPLAIILPYLIFQSINWKLLNKTKIKNFIILSIPLLIIFILFLKYLVDFILSFYTVQQSNIILLIILLFIACTINYITTISYKLNTLDIKKILNQSKKQLNKLFLQYSLFSTTQSILIILTLAAISIMITIQKWIIYIIPIILIILILFNYQRTSLIKKLK